MDHHPVDASARPMKQAEAGTSRRALLAAAALLALSSRVDAQTLPRMARLIVGFPAGGAADGLARLISQHLRGQAAETVLVDNRVGAGARIAIEYVRNAAADGSVMLLAPDATMFLYPHVYRKLSYDPGRDFTPVARLVGMALAMFVGAMVPASVRTVADYVAWAKAEPGRLVYGTPAAGATPHFNGAMFARAAGLALTPVHYKGGAPGIQDLAAGQLPVFFGSVADGLALVQAGKLRALATSGARRTALLGDVPTFVEAGYRDLTVEDGLGIYLPAHTPADRVDRLGTALLAALRTREVERVVRGWGFEVSGEGPHPFAARLQRERARWESIVKATGFAALD